MKIREIQDEEYKNYILNFGFELDDHIEDFKNFYEVNIDKTEKIWYIVFRKKKRGENGIKM